MTEPSNAVLSEQIRRLRKDFYEFKNSTKDEIKEMEDKVDGTKEIASQVNFSLKYVKESVDKMDKMMGNFIQVVNYQNEKNDTFVNSDKRMSNKRQLTVSILQVISGIVIAVIGFWTAGKI